MAYDKAAVANVLLEAANVIRRLGWTQGDDQPGGPGTSVCAYGAMMCAVAGTDDVHDVYRQRDLVIDTFPHATEEFTKVIGNPSVAQWNDTVATCQEDVITAFEQAVANVKEGT